MRVLREIWAPLARPPGAAAGWRSRRRQQPDPGVPLVQFFQGSARCHGVACAEGPLSAPRRAATVREARMALVRAGRAVGSATRRRRRHAFRLARAGSGRDDQRYRGRRRSLAHAVGLNRTGGGSTAVSRLGWLRGRRRLSDATGPRWSTGSFPVVVAIRHHPHTPVRSRIWPRIPRPLRLILPHIGQTEP